jgi:hypothetical protein
MPKRASGSAVDDYFAITQIKLCGLGVFELA